MGRKISIIVPIFNEQHNLPLLLTSIQAAISSLAKAYEFELIFIDDGSSDLSWSVIQDLASRYSYITGIKLSRNFGHQIALMAGYDHAKGDAVISLDADLQHPPQLIPEMIRAWEQGNFVVCARRTDWDDTRFKKWTASLYYYFLERISSVAIQRGVGDFRLLDRAVVQAVRQSKERSLFLRGIVAWCGFKKAFIGYHCPARIHGTSGYSWKKMVRLGFDGIMGFSGVLVRLPLVITMLASLMAALVLLVPISLSPTFLFFVLLATQSLFAWITLEYVSRIYDASRTRPLYAVEQYTRTYPEQGVTSWSTPVEKNI